MIADSTFIGPARFASSVCQNLPRKRFTAEESRIILVTVFDVMLKVLSI